MNEQRTPSNVGTPQESDALAVIRAHLEAREGEGSGELLYVGDRTPAGSRGADSGEAGATGVDASDDDGSGLAPRPGDG